VLSKNISNTSSTGLGSLRRTFQTTILIDSILRAGESANEPVGQSQQPGFAQVFTVEIGQQNCMKHGEERQVLLYHAVYNTVIAALMRWKLQD
jgi:hypothetical protein